MASHHSYLCLLAQMFWAVGLCASCLPAQTLTISPPRVLRDQTAVIGTSALRPHEPVTLKADLVDGEGQRWVSEAEFVADAGGNLDLSRQAP